LAKIGDRPAEIRLQAAIFYFRQIALGLGQIQYRQTILKIWRHSKISTIWTVRFLQKLPLNCLAKLDDTNMQ
jgi:hypothetical protein